MLAEIRVVSNPEDRVYPGAHDGRVDRLAVQARVDRKAVEKHCEQVRAQASHVRFAPFYHRVERGARERAHLGIVDARGVERAR